MYMIYMIYIIIRYLHCYLLLQNRHTTFKFMVCKTLAIQGLNDNTCFIPYKGGSFMSVAIRIVTVEVIHLIYCAQWTPTSYEWGS